MANSSFFPIFPLLCWNKWDFDITKMKLRKTDSRKLTSNRQQNWKKFNHSFIEWVSQSDNARGIRYDTVCYIKTGKKAETKPCYERVKALTQALWQEYTGPEHQTFIIEKEGHQEKPWWPCTNVKLRFVCCKVYKVMIP